MKQTIEQRIEILKLKLVDLHFKSEEAVKLLIALEKEVKKGRKK
jgi:hypothetical protein